MDKTKNSCKRCKEAHELLDKYDIPRTGQIWSVGSGIWLVSARIEKLIDNLKTNALSSIKYVFEPEEDEG